MNRTSFTLASAALLVGLHAAPVAAQVQASTTVARAPGLYVQVIDGTMIMSNTGGAQQLSAGQFGYTPSVVQPPVVLPKNPGIAFTPPPSFASVAGTYAPGSSANSSSKSNTNSVDCEVR